MKPQSERNDRSVYVLYEKALRAEEAGLPRAARTGFAYFVSKAPGGIGTSDSVGPKPSLASPRSTAPSNLPILRSSMSLSPSCRSVYRQRAPVRRLD
jgi:hypothetical protein